MARRPVTLLPPSRFFPFLRQVLSLLAVVVVCLSPGAPLTAQEDRQPQDEDPASRQFRELRALYHNNPGKAVGGFREFLKQYGQTEWADDAQYWLAMSLDKSRARSHEVIEAWQTLVDQYPNSSYRNDALFAIAETWRDRGRRPEDFNEAVKAYLYFIEHCPGSERLGEAKLKLGETYLRLKDDEKAAAAFRRVAEEHPDSPFAVPANMQLAAAYLRLKRVDDALAIYSKVLKLDLPDNQRIAARLGTVDGYLLQPDGLDQALKTCADIREEARQKKSLEDYAEYKTREKMASYYLGQKKYGEAEAEYEAYIGRFGTSVGVWQARLNIGMIRLAAGKPDEARKAFQAITSSHTPGAKDTPWYLPQAMYYEAFTYEVEKNRDEAVRLFKKVVELYPRNYWGRSAARRIEALEKQPEPPPEPEKK